MAEFHIKHITRYSYTSTVIDCTNQVMLYPINDEHQNVQSHELKITNNPPIETFTDYFGNKVGMFSIIAPHNVLLIESDIVVSTRPVEFPERLPPPAEEWATLAELKSAYPYLDFMDHEALIAVDELNVISARTIDKQWSPFHNGRLLSEYVYNNFEYKKGVTSVETKVDEILALKAGVCQDFAHLLLVLLHCNGIPARYVSGYICPDKEELRGAGATHAWVEAYTPGYGWVGLDPTNNCIASDRHVKLAIGRNFSDCTPVKGTYKGSSEHTLEVSVEINSGTTPSGRDSNALESYGYTTQNPALTGNSYRHFLEMQQQQQ